MNRTRLKGLFVSRMKQLKLNHIQLHFTMFISFSHFTKI